MLFDVRSLLRGSLLSIYGLILFNKEQGWRNYCFKTMKELFEIFSTWRIKFSSVLKNELDVHHTLSE